MVEIHIKNFWGIFFKKWLKCTYKKGGIHIKKGGMTHQNMEKHIK